MKNRAFIGKALFVAGITGVGVFGALSATSKVEADPGLGGFCICPWYWDPVLCPDGKVYSNECFAGCAGQTGCQNLGQGPVPVPM